MERLPKGSKLVAMTYRWRGASLGEPNLPMPFPVLQAATALVIAAPISSVRPVLNACAHL
jgi:hypothetical protein